MYFACVKFVVYNVEGLRHNHFCKTTIQTFCEYNMQLYLRCHNKFHIPNFNGSLVIGLETKPYSIIH